MNNIIVRESARNLRALGRLSMQRDYKLSMTGTAVYLAALMIPATLIILLINGTVGETASGLYSLLVSGPFTLGLSLFYLNFFRRKEASIENIFYGFEHFFKSLGLFLYMSVLIFLWSLLFLIPGVIASFRYSQAFYILADNPDYSIRQCINESKALMINNKWSLFILTLTFVGWGLLCSAASFAVGALITQFPDLGILQVAMLLAYIPYIWLLAYMVLALVAFYEILTGNLKAELDTASIEGEGRV